MPWVVKVLTIFNNWCSSQKFQAYVPLFPAENLCARARARVCVYNTCSNKRHRSFCYCEKRTATTENSGNTSYYYISR